jgi:molybdopterin/thiamine biosynthesis adenylyltransferase
VFFIRLEASMTPGKIQHLLEIHSENRNRPDGNAYISLSFSAGCRIAEQTGHSLKEIELQALNNNIVPERYCRNQVSLSNSDQGKLLQSHVAVIGLGGLGGTVTEILARIGVGKLTLVDGDSFDDSNLNRQILSSPTNLGRPKAKVAAERVSDINPAVETCPVETFFTGQNGEKILQDVHLVVDCLDTISDRFVVEASCQALLLPMVSGAIAGSCGQATVILPGDSGLKRIYGTPQRAPKKGVEASVGTLPFAAIYMAAVECAEAVTILLGNSPELQNKLFLADVREHTSDLVDLS